MIEAEARPRAVAFFDIDGTLMQHFVKSRNPNDVPSQAVQDAVREFVAAGNVAFLSTGRSPAGISDVIRSLPFSGMVCADGAYVEFGGTPLLDAMIEDDLVEALVQEQLDCGSLGGYEDRAGIFEVDRDGRNLAPNVVPVRSLDELHEQFPDLHVWKVNVEGDNWDRLVKGSRVLDKFEHFYAGSGQHELAAVGVSKGRGARLLLQSVKHAPEHVLGFGDSPNDIPIFELADVAVAMGNANERTRSAADVVTDDVDHDGVATGLAQLAHLWR